MPLSEECFAGACDRCDNFLKLTCYCSCHRVKWQELADPARGSAVGRVLVWAPILLLTSSALLSSLNLPGIKGGSHGDRAVHLSALRRLSGPVQVRDSAADVVDHRLPGVGRLPDRAARRRALLVPPCPPSDDAGVGGVSLEPGVLGLAPAGLQPRMVDRSRRDAAAEVLPPAGGCPASEAPGEEGQRAPSLYVGAGLHHLDSPASVEATS